MERKLTSTPSSSLQRPSPVTRRPRAARRRGGAALARAVEALERRRLLTVTQPTVALDASTDGGALGDLITNYNTPTLTGTGTAGNTIAVYDGTTLLGAASVASNGTWTFDTADSLDDGMHAISVTASDGQGSAAVSSTMNLLIDTMAPTLSVKRVTAANANGWNNTDVIVSATASDNGGSGLLSTPGYQEFTFTLEKKSQSKSFMAFDVAGNATLASIGKINIDKTPPTLLSVTRATAANAYGWNNTDVVFNYTASDALSGLTASAGACTFTTEGAGQTRTLVVTDLAGNTVSTTLSGVNIDKSAPVINVSRDVAANANGWNNTDVNVTYSINDVLSGQITGDPASGAFAFTVEGAGQSRTLTATDRAGNTVSVTVTANIDKSAPVITAQRDTAANASGWNNTDVSASFATSDASGLATPGSGTFVFTAEGANQSHTFTVTDLAGNTASATVGGVNIDKTAPTLSVQRDTAANQYGWNNSDVQVSYSAADALSGASSASGAFTFSAEGAGQSHTFTVTDLAGNTVSMTIGGVNIDKTAPALVVQRDTAANAYGWNNADVSASYSAGDSLSGLVGPGSGSYLFSGEGANQSHTFTVTDMAGNTVSASVGGVNIDKTAPTLSGSPDRAANSHGWYNSNVTVSFSGGDVLSGLLSVSGPTVLGEGAGQSVVGTATDLAGNTVTFTVGGINVDETAPTLSAARATAANALGWNNTNVVANYTAGDSLSGLFSAASGSFTFADEGAGQSHTFQVCDMAGNVTTVTIAGVNIDRTAPMLSVTRNIAPNANGWNNTNVLSSYSASDALAGLDSAASGGFTFSSEGANQSHTFTVTDRAGNSTTFVLGGVNIDKTGPALSLPANVVTTATSSSGALVNYLASATDGLSGLDVFSTSQASGSLFGVGTTTVTVSATDKAGNLVTGSFTITVNPMQTTKVTGVGADGNLYVYTTGSAADIRIDARSRSHITISGTGSGAAANAVFSISDGARIIVFGTAGDDDIEVKGFVSAEIHGGDGNDSLHGGNGDDVIYGDAGNDRLVGGGGNDVLVGGGGDDVMMGSTGSDVFVGVALTTTSSTYSSLDTMRKSWLKHGTLNAPATMKGNADGHDQIQGGAGREWYVVDKADKVVAAKEAKKDASKLKKHDDYLELM